MIAALSFALAVPRPLAAGPFTPGNVVVVRVGDETTQGSKGIQAPVVLEEIPATGGAAMNQVALPGGVTLPVGEPATGFLTRSPGGQFLTLAGNGDKQAVVVRVNGLGVAEAIARAGTARSAGGPGSAAFVEGQDVCFLGGSPNGPAPGLRLLSLTKDGPVQSPMVAGTVGQVAVIADGEGKPFLIYETPLRIFGAGELPLRGWEPAAFPIVSAFATGSSGFALLDRDPVAGADGLGGLDTMYLAVETNLLKFEWSPQGWVERGGATYTKFHAVAAREREGGVDLYATATGAGEDILVKVTDDAKFGEAWDRAPRDFTVLASSGPAEFRGVAFSPENLNLKELSIDEGELEPRFEGEVGTYKVILGSEVISLSANAEEASVKVEVRVNGGAFASVNEVSLPLEPGRNTVEVRVQSTESKASRYYSIEALRVVPPSLAAPSPPKISGTSASVTGEVTQDGGAGLTERGVVWELSGPNVDPALTGMRARAKSDPAPGSFTVDLSGLAPGETYVFRTYATNGAGTTYSPPASFATEAYLWSELAGEKEEPGVHSGRGEAGFASPFGVAVNRAGEVFVADAYNHTIRKIAPDGVVTTVAGKAGSAGSLDGAGTEARFYSPYGVAVGPGGVLYVVDSYNHSIRKIDPAGVVSTLAGKAGFPGSADGTGETAQFSFPRGIAIDAAGDLYVADTHNHTIRKVTPSGEVTTIAGSSGIAGSSDGDRSKARFDYPLALAVDRVGAIYVADSGNKVVRKIAPGAGGQVTTLAGAAKAYGKADGLGREARFGNPQGIAVNEAGTVFVADTTSQAIRMIAPDGVVSTLVVKPSVSAAQPQEGHGERRAPVRNNSYPFGVATDATGAIYVADPANKSVRKIFKGAPKAE